MDYMCTKFGTHSPSRFSFRARTDRHTHTVTGHAYATFTASVGNAVVMARDIFEYLLKLRNVYLVSFLTIIFSLLLSFYFFLIKYLCLLLSLMSSHIILLHLFTLFVGCSPVHFVYKTTYL